MLMVVLVVMAFVLVVVDLRSLSRFRLGVVLEGIGRTQRFAFQARHGAPKNCPTGLEAAGPNSNWDVSG
jgi:hypothetical protein